MFEQRPDIQARLHTELVAWLTTVAPDGQPQSSVVWFLARTDDFIVYSVSGTPRVRNIRAKPKVCLALNSTPTGGELVIVEGVATIEDGGIPANEDPDYLAKYEEAILEAGWTPESFASDYPLRVHVRPTRLRAS
jgi:PPOX class probable F420-dependent enzyme